MTLEQPPAENTNTERSQFSQVVLGISLGIALLLAVVAAIALTHQ